MSVGFICHSRVRRGVRQYHFHTSVMQLIKSLNLTSIVQATIIRLRFLKCSPPFDAEKRQVFRHDAVPIP